MASTEASRRGNCHPCYFPSSTTLIDTLFIASVASSSEMSFADSTTATKLLPKKESKKEKPTGGVKLKKSLAKKTKPKDAESNGMPYLQFNLRFLDQILIIQIQERIRQA